MDRLKKVVLVMLLFSFALLFTRTAFAVITWDTTEPMSSERVLPAVTTVTTAGGGTFIYAVGGGTAGAACSNGTGDGKVFFAESVGDGLLGAWAETGGGTGNFIRVAPGIAVGTNNYIYIAGGAINSPSWDGNVYYAQPATNGTISSWTQSANSMPQWIGSFPFMASYNSFLYVGGGRNAFTNPRWSNRLYYANIDPITGAPGAWHTATNLPSTAGEGKLVFYNNKAYLILGRTDDSTTSTAVYYTTHDHMTGALGTWTATTSLPAPGNNSHAAFWGDKLYVILNGGAVYYSVVQGDGSLGEWIADTSVPATIIPGYVATLQGDYYYIAGTYDCAGSTTVRYGKISTGGSISGKAETGDIIKPIGGVTVKLYPVGSDTMITSTMTNHQGVYTFDNLASGYYRVLFETNGFVTQAFNGKASLASADTITVTAPDSTTGIDANLSIAVGKDRYLGIVKTGLGTIVDNYERINCGSICTASYSDATESKVTLHFRPASGYIVNSIKIDPPGGLTLGGVFSLTFRGITPNGQTVLGEFTQP